MSLTRDKRCTAGIGHNAFPSCVNGLQATDYRLNAVKDGLGANGIGMHKFQQKYKEDEKRHEKTQFKLTNEDDGSCESTC